MFKATNKAHVEGYVFNHTLEKREAGPNAKNPGQVYIRGRLNIATDEDAMNIVTVNFTYVTDKKKDTFDVLNQIIENGTTYEQAKTDASKVRVSAQIAVNDFFGRDGELVAAKTIEGSFVNFMTTGISAEPATFEIDMLVDTAQEVTPEEGDAYMKLSGNAFDFRGQLVPVDVTVKNPKGIEWFEDQNISKKNPLLVNLWGKFISTTTTDTVEVESDWGAPKVNVSSRTFRSWDVEGSSVDGLEFGDSITVDELKAAVEAREEHLADVKKRNEEYNASKSGKAGFPATQPASNVAEDDDDEFPF